MKARPTLICIPDISGFTQFMSDMDFELTSKVIPALLNNIIYSNEIGLKVSEIEGDAVLFYRPGELPPFEKLVKQCKYFYTEFYKQLAFSERKAQWHQRGLKNTFITWFENYPSLWGRSWGNECR